MKIDTEQITLGGLIKLLEGERAGNTVVFSNGLYPGEVYSYRGFYEDLALEPVTISYPENNVYDLVEYLQGAVGNTYIGYKGGEYQMTEETPLWVAKYGEWVRPNENGDMVCTIITHVTSEEDMTTIHLKEIVEF